MAETRVWIASQPFSYLEIWIDFGMFEAVAIDPVRSWNDVIGTVRETTAIWVVNFFGVVSIGVVSWVHGLN